MGKFNFGEVTGSWSLFSAMEKRNIAIYIAGIMLYKFGLEAFNGSITALATNRYDWEAARANRPEVTFARLGLLQGLNQAFQCVGSILIGPLIKRFPTKLVLAVAIFCFGILNAILLVVDAATGGSFKPRGWKPKDENDFGYYGYYNSDAIIPIYCISGIAYGMVELIRRVIPRDIVGGNVQKLRRMDALVHIFYEVAGTAGAFCTALALIPRFGNNMSFIITPIFFTLASIVWYFISNLDYTRATKLERAERKKKNYFLLVAEGFLFFGKSVYVGGRILLTNRRYIWLIPGYSVALYGHRYLENGLAPQIARRYLGNSAWSQIMVGGSNFGELLGAAFVFVFTNFIQTPMPWLRLDALTLLIVWYLPYWYPRRGRVSEAWKVAGTFIPVSFGWAAGDVSLAAYIQASLARIESQNSEVSALGSVMACLYSTYIVIYAIAQPLLGRYVDATNTRTGSIRPAIRNLAGVQFTIISAVVFASTFIPKGAIAFNPQMLNDQALDHDLDKVDPRASSDDDLKHDMHNGTLDDRRQSITRSKVGVEDTFDPDMQTIAAHEKTTVGKV